MAISASGSTTSEKLREAISSMHSGNADIYEVGSIVVVGEYHVYAPGVSLKQKELVQEKARTSKWVLLEGRKYEGADQNDSYISLAQYYSHPIRRLSAMRGQQILDIDQSDTENRRKLYESQLGLRASDERLLYFNTLLFLGMLTMFSVARNIDIQQELGAYLNDQPLAQTLPIDTVRNIISETFKDLTSASELLIQLAGLDSLVRERGMQSKVAAVVERYKDDSILIVVGKNHAEGIARTVKDPTYRTPIDRDRFADAIKKLEEEL